ncbi:MAG: endonuclease/exonuclease/phosphatase family protein [Desulfohalobiaceae bacterium]|nr:endonuclease/exonuclease/phosphatase family protein [Desulfohalobiaceae bacterium]
MNKPLRPTARITNLNLRFGRADDGPNSWERRKAAYPEFLKTYPSDFYTFQEANDFQVRFLAGLLPEYSYIGHTDPVPDWWQSNVVFHHRRWQCLDQDHFYLSQTPEVPSKFEQSRWPRQCTLGSFALKNQRLLVMTTHFDFNEGVKLSSTGLLLERLKQHPDHLPVVLSGDFNATPDSPCYKTLTSSGGFENVFQPPYKGTYHGFSGTDNDEHIDWILYRGDIEVLQAQLVTEPFAGLYPSDHFALTAFFKLSTQAGRST